MYSYRLPIILALIAGFLLAVTPSSQSDQDLVMFQPPATGGRPSSVHPDQEEFTYRTTFVLPKNFRARDRCILELPPVTCHASIFLNHRLVASYGYPNLPSRHDISTGLKTDQLKQFLEIRVRNYLGLPLIHLGERNGFHRSGSLASWKTARMDGTPTIVFRGPERGLITSIRTKSSLKEQNVTIRPEFWLEAPIAESELRVILLDEDRIVTEEEVSLDDLSTGTNTAVVTLEAINLKPWGRPPHGRPIVYTLRVTWSKNGKIIDEQEQLFGYRIIDIKSGRLHLNGQPLGLVGQLISPERLADTNLQDLPSIFNESEQLNCWHIHSGIPTETSFKKADQLGWYLIPGGICFGEWTPGALDNYDKQFLRGYIDAFTQTFAHHPSFLLFATDPLPIGKGSAPVWYGPDTFEGLLMGRDLGRAELIRATNGQIVVDHKRDPYVHDQEPIIIFESLVHPIPNSLSSDLIRSVKIGDYAAIFFPEEQP